MITCPIWGTPAIELPEYINRDGSGYDSPRAGGRYFLTRTAHAMVQALDDDSKVRLTHEIVSNLIGNSTLEISSYVVNQIKIASPSPPGERADRLLNYLARLSPHLGAVLRFPGALEFYPSEAPKALNLDTGFYSWPLYAWSDSTRYQELEYLVEMLSDDDLISTTGREKPPEIVVRPKGYAHLELARRNVASDQAFLAMWFDPSMDEAFAHGFDPGIRDAGYRPLRIDQKEHLNKIDDEIIAEIRRSRFVVADFTSALGSPRGGVYYEAGFAAGLGLEVVWTCRADLIGDVHFDTRQFNHIVWQNPVELRKRLSDRIRATIGQGPLPSP
jgi:hypothetical protein